MLYWPRNTAKQHRRGTIPKRSDQNRRTTRQVATQRFIDRYAEDPAHIVFSPGRVNLIGEHTDYNDGFVLPMALDLGVWIALRPREDDKVFLASKGRKNPIELHLRDLSGGIPVWGRYVQGVAWALKEAGFTLRGWEGVMVADVPAGAGLASSAALEVAVARTFAAVVGETWLPPVVAKAAQRAENEWIGMPCGIMDQMAASVAQPGELLFLDCRSLETELLTLPEEVELVVLDTAKRRSLTESRYRVRREQCETAARVLGAPSLRDISAPEFGQKARQLDPVLRKRAMHVIHENARVQRVVQAVREHDPASIGVLLNAGHESLRDDFEVSCRELDTMAELSQNHAACYGARMTGAGFGGCVVALVRKGEGQRFAETVTTEYHHRTGLEPWWHLMR